MNTLFLFDERGAQVDGDQSASLTVHFPSIGRCVVNNANTMLFNSS